MHTYIYLIAFVTSGIWNWLKTIAAFCTQVSYLLGIFLSSQQSHRSSDLSDECAYLKWIVSDSVTNDEWRVCISAFIDVRSDNSLKLNCISSSMSADWHIQFVRIFLPCCLIYVMCIPTYKCTHAFIRSFSNSATLRRVWIVTIGCSPQKLRLNLFYWNNDCNQRHNNH